MEKYTKMPILRNYRDSDYQAVRQMFKDAKMYDSVWDSRKNFKEKIRRSPRSVIVAEDRGQVVGHVMWVADGWEAFIFRLVVDEQYRSRGIGGLLMEEAERRLRRRGVHEVSILIRKEKQYLAKYYSHRGYELTGNKYITMYKKL